MRLLFVGDSMTIGRAGERTWRYWMTRHLRDCPACRGTGGPPAVVGPWTHQYEGEGEAERTGAGRAADDAAGDGPHLAAWGEGWLHMASRVRAAVREARPDVLLVSLGLIDLGFYTDSAGTEANVLRFFAEARAAAPRIRAVVLPVVPNVRAGTDALFAAEVERFNARLARLLAGIGGPRSPLLLAPPPTAPPVSYDIRRDTYDGTHPSPSGARKLAAAFADALHSLRGPAAGPGGAAGALLGPPAGVGGVRAPRPGAASGASRSG
ncbi:GDSL-type esterase/lipase family protein [Streptomyces sp. DW26H14]|uniref:GDSL-type esterase/lipase family protein n=1 Tax=Streptomyces sp. DW26H14 TaxID=3435395 RepID=UPI00403DE70F